MLTVEVELRESNPVDPVLTVYRIQKRSNRNLGQALGAVACGSIRWCPVGVAGLGLGRTKVPGLSRQIAVSWTEAGHHPLPWRVRQTRGQGRPRRRRSWDFVPTP